MMNEKKNYTPEETERIHKIMLSTGNVNKPYVVRDIVFVAERLETDIFDTEGDPNSLLADIAFLLKAQAYEYGATAVINCHFEHEHVNKNGKDAFEIFAYGTVVQFTQSTIGG
ncbi:heavy metal-binding domain-containing protein [Enterococcus olivae]